MKAIFIHDDKDFNTSCTLDVIFSKIKKLNLIPSYNIDLNFGGKSIGKENWFGDNSLNRPITFVIGQKEFIEKIMNLKFKQQDSGVYFLNIQDLTLEELLLEIEGIVELNQKDYILALKKLRILPSKGLGDIPTLSMWVDYSGSISDTSIEGFLAEIKNINKK